MHRVMFIKIIIILHSENKCNGVINNPTAHIKVMLKTINPIITTLSYSYKNLKLLLGYVPYILVIRRENECNQIITNLTTIIRTGILKTATMRIFGWLYTVDIGQYVG